MMKKKTITILKELLTKIGESEKHKQGKNERKLDHDNSEIISIHTHGGEFKHKEGHEGSPSYYGSYRRNYNTGLDRGQQFGAHYYSTRGYDEEYVHTIHLKLP